MITRLFRRPALHEHAEAAQRLVGVEMLPPGSDELAQLLATDPAPEVRIAAVQRCANLRALAGAWDAETDSSVRDALASTLSKVLAETEDQASAKAFLESGRCTDAIRSTVARQASDPE